MNLRFGKFSKTETSRMYQKDYDGVYNVLVKGND